MKYFFDTQDGAAGADAEGVELPDMARARVEAIRYAGAVMSHEPDVLWDGRDFHVFVSDATGLLLFDVCCQVNNAPAAGDTK
jgi:hypothetical protein